MKSPRNIFVRILIGVCLFSCCSCRKSESKILSKDKMADVLADVYLTDIMLQQIDRKTKNSWSNGMKDIYFQDLSYRRILEKHHITEGDFYASVDHYSRQYKVSARIYAQVVSNLQQRQYEVNRLDSLATVERERLLFEKKWKEVNIDTTLIPRWYSLFKMDSLTLQLDSLLWKDSLQLGGNITDRWMNLARFDSSLIRPMDRLQTDTAYMRLWTMRLEYAAETNRRLSQEGHKYEPDSTNNAIDSTPLPSKTTLEVEQIDRESRPKIKKKDLSSPSKFRTNDGRRR